MKKFKHIVYAGTFDRLHAGHKKLLDKAFELAEQVSIGITSKSMLKHKVLSQIIEPIGVRRKAISEYLKEKKYRDETEIFELKDIYGPSTAHRKKSSPLIFDSILVTELTKKNAEKINEKRVARNLQPLKIIIEELVRGNDGEIVSSDRIRMGEIDRSGISYQLSVFSKNRYQLVLPKGMRNELRKPLGKVVGGSVKQLQETVYKVIKFLKSIKPVMVISVGDIITDSLMEGDFEPDIKIVDFRSRRMEIKVNRNSNSNKNMQEKLINNAGTINLRTALEIKNTIKENLKTGKKQLIIVEGEEDLLALPAILFAPLNSLVLYGQFDMGVVMVEVTEEKKQEIAKILAKFN